MTLKQYNRIRIVLTFISALIYSQAFVSGNFIIPVAVMILVVVLLMLLRKKVTEVVADERDKFLGGDAALFAIKIYSLTAALAMFAFFALRHSNPVFESIAVTLAYSTCLLLAIYSAVFAVKSRRGKV